MFDFVMGAGLRSRTSLLAKGFDDAINLLLGRVSEPSACLAAGADRPAGFFPGRGFTFAGANRLEASGQGPWNA